MRTFTNPLHVARRMLATDEAWLLFVEVQLATSYFRMVRDTRHREANGHWWQRATIDIELPSEDATGSLGQLVIAIPNVSQIALSYVEVEDELLGRNITAWLAHESDLSTFEPSLSWRHRILSFECDELVGRFACGHSAELMRIPGPLFDRVKFPQLLATAGVTL